MKKNKLLLLLLILLAMSLWLKAQNTWLQIAGLQNIPREHAGSFIVSNRGFVTMGSSCYDSSYNDLWEYIPGTNSWNQKASFPGTSRHGASVFVIDTVVYLFCGQHNSNAGMMKDVWRYSPVTDTWSVKNNFPGTSRSDAFSFAMNGKGYMGGGLNSLGIELKDFWEYNPITDTWTQKADFAGGTRRAALSLEIDGRGYVGMGIDIQSNQHSDFWEYNSTNDTWTQKADFGGGNSYRSRGFAICGKGYVVASYKDTVWMYTPSADHWTKKGHFPALTRVDHLAFSLSKNGTEKGYCGSGYTYPNGVCSYDFYEFTPDSCMGVNVSDLYPYLQTVSINPNPASTHFTLVNPLNETIEIRISDIFGQLIFNTVASSKAKKEISCILWPDGLYIVQILHNKQIISVNKIYVRKN